MASMSVSSSQGFTSNKTDVLAITFGFSFLLIVSLQSLLCDSLLLFIIFLLIRTKEVDIVVIVSCRGWGCLCGWLSSLKSLHTSCQGENQCLQVVSNFLERFILNFQITEFLHKSHFFAH